MSEIKNLNQLKRAVNEGRTFVIKKHYIRPNYAGQRRKPNVVQTNGFYSIIPDDPDSVVSTANNGKGSWIEFGKASDWTFENDICKQTSYGRDVWEIEFE